MSPRMIQARALVFLGVAAFAAPQRPQTFTGFITDSMCANGNHSSMQMGPTGAECTIACIRAHGASYVLFDGKRAYMLSDQATPEKFAGKKVKVTGTLDSKTGTIRVDSIAAAN
jgi:phage terminase large subunit